MYIPKTIRIGSYDYAVNQTNKTLVINAKQCKGTIDYNYHTIDIDTSIQDRQGQEETLLHELFHGIVNERNLDLTNSNEEIIVEELARGLHQVIRDNPDMFKNKEEK